MFKYNTHSFKQIPIINVVIIYLSISLCTGCEKFIEVDAPITSINRDNVYGNNSNATSVLTGIYAKMSSSTFSLDLSLYPELSSDNFGLYDQNNIGAKSYFTNSLNSSYPGSVPGYWNDIYSYIYVTNSAIEGISASSNITTGVKNRLLGEAYFLRGFYYFYLVNLFENVPIVLSTDYSKSSNIGNSISNLVYLQIIDDFKKAEQLLDESYVDGSVQKNTVDRVRPNKFSATAMLARVYLYSKNYEEAEKEASKVIEKSDLYSLTGLNSVFLKNSSETIWSLQPVKTNTNSMEGDFFIYPDGGPNNNNFIYLAPNLMSSFEEGDLRKTEWIGNFDIGSLVYHYPFKYKVKNGPTADATEYTMVLRLSEQYLIRAEARAELGNIEGAVEDINTIRRRSRAEPSIDIPIPLPDYQISLTQEQLATAILHERRVELFSEWGNRWFDLKRTNKLNQVMQDVSSEKNERTWSASQSIYPIPLLEIQRNPKLEQNEGY